MALTQSGARTRAAETLSNHHLDGEIYFGDKKVSAPGQICRIVPPTSGRELLIHFPSD